MSGTEADVANVSSAADPLDRVAAISNVDIAMAIVRAAVISFLAVLGSAVNLLALLIFLKRPALRSPSNRFVVSLVLGNLLTAAVLVPSTLMARHRDPWLRRSLSALAIFAVAGSVLSVVCIALDRHSAVLSPLHYSSPGTKQRARVLLGVAWGLALLQATLPLTIGAEPPSLIFSQSQTPFRIAYASSLATLGLIIPLLILCVIYARMYGAAQRNSERTRRHSVTDVVALTRQGSVFSREEGRAVKTAAIVVTSFLLCWTPYFAGLLAGPWAPTPFGLFALSAALSNGVVTPFVYVFRSEAARREALSILCWWKPRVPPDKALSCVKPANNLRIRPPPLGYFETSTEQESMSVHSYNTDCITNDAIKSPLHKEPTSLELRSSCPPGLNGGRRRDNVTLRLLPRVNGGRRCQSCVRQNSDSSCGSGQALLARDSSLDSASNTPQRRKRPASSVETSLSSSGMGRSMDSEETGEEGETRPTRPKLQRLPAVEDED
ncbi:alpha-1A adrenergic receptor-like [Neocloeon triangulifer]|uniref:alpha-1A adrenergic receptor-like n=1 Tax=Neocloeon triangulifer TaxID=2078957 RepID=UPI00286EC94B|nr:alpha-1A adrenergic receptor-like [Neocloeon triangulifer]XP_059485079.1 alpha-1A adrenergic receptor-like [Neocloeon triangulifer]